MQLLRESIVYKRFGKCLHDVRTRKSACIRRQLSSDNAQSTVEYAIIFAAFLALVIALGALWNLFDSGLVVDHALQSASHHLREVAQGAWLDVFLY